LKDANAVPASIAAGPDGALWAADGSLGRLWRITTMGRVPSIDVGSGPADAVTGPDAVDVAADPQDMTLAPVGDLYIALHNGTIGRLTLDGEFSRAARMKSDADTITVGPDGDVWYGAGDQGQVGRVRVP